MHLHRAIPTDHAPDKCQQVIEPARTIFLKMPNENPTADGEAKSHKKIPRRMTSHEVLLKCYTQPMYGPDQPFSEKRI